MHYIQPDPALADVDPRFSSLPFDLQTRVAELMYTVDRVPMTLAVDAVLMTERNEDDHSRDRSQARRMGH